MTTIDFLLHGANVDFPCRRLEAFELISVGLPLMMLEARQSWLTLFPRGASAACFPLS